MNMSMATFPELWVGEISAPLNLAYLRAGGGGWLQLFIFTTTRAHTIHNTLSSTTRHTHNLILGGSWTPPQ